MERYSHAGQPYLAFRGETPYNTERSMRLGKRGGHVAGEGMKRFGSCKKGLTGRLLAFLEGVFQSCEKV